MKVKVRNPLGLLSLFMTAMYATAVVVLEREIFYLNAPLERLAVVSLVVGFPFVFLGVCCWLIVYHHAKLFSPRDYRSDDAYERIVLGDRKRKEEVELLTAAATASRVGTAKDNAPGADSTASRQDQTTTTTPRPGAQVPMSVREYDRIELLATAWVSRRYSVPLERDVVLDVGGRRTVVDAVGRLGNTEYFVEVKYWLADRDLKQLFQSLGEVLRQLRGARGKKQRMLVVVVVLDRPDEAVKKDIVDYVSKHEEGVQLHVLSKEDL